jgi:hypothetical protein
MGTLLSENYHRFIVKYSTCPLQKLVEQFESSGLHGVLLFQGAAVAHEKHYANENLIPYILLN